MNVVLHFVFVPNFWQCTYPLALSHLAYPSPLKYFDKSSIVALLALNKILSSSYITKGASGAGLDNNAFAPFNACNSHPCTATFNIATCIFFPTNESIVIASTGVGTTSSLVANRVTLSSTALCSKLLNCCSPCQHERARFVCQGFTKTLDPFSNLVRSPHSFAGRKRRIMI